MEGGTFQPDLPEHVGLVGRSECLQAVARLIDLAAGVDAPVMITGETGTGKNVVARAIHKRSARREVEQGHILRVLKHHSYNLTRSAKVLGISLSTLKRKVKTYGLK